MKVPLLDLSIQHDPIREEILEAIGKVIQSQRFILGPEVTRLEERMASICQTRFSVGVSSGTDALLVSLMALGVGPEDEVVTSAFSFFATAGVIARLGAKPVFVDIDPASYNIDPEGIATAITSRSKAIVPVHLYGQCADIESVMSVAEQEGVAVVEDAAQAIGALGADGRPAGSVGDLSCLSFYPTKNLAAVGEAGMVLTGDEALHERIRILRDHGAEPKYHHRVIGGNFRLDAIQAAVLNVKLNYLEDWTKARRRNASRYFELFEEAGLDDRVGLPTSVHGTDHHVFNQFIIRAKDRDALREALGFRRIGTEIYYPIPFHLQECFRYLGYSEGDFPESERAARETLALPIYPGLTEEQQRYVVDAIREFYASGGRIL